MRGAGGTQPCIVLARVVEERVNGDADTIRKPFA